MISSINPQPIVHTLMTQYSNASLFHENINALGQNSPYLLRLSVLETKLKQNLVSPPKDGRFFPKKYFLWGDKRF